MRWHHPTLGHVPPSTFIPIAARAGLIARLGDWALRRALLDVQAAQRFGNVRVNVNVSPIQLLSPDFAARVLNTLAELGTSPDLLTLEVTESTVMQNVTLACQHLEQLRQAGVHVALDDFGSGHSSLALLADLPLDTVKLDRSFLRETTRGDRNSTRWALLGNTIRLARDLRLYTVAGGVEDEAMLSLLRDLRCDAAQKDHIDTPDRLKDVSRPPNSFVRPDRSRGLPPALRPAAQSGRNGRSFCRIVRTSVRRFGFRCSTVISAGPWSVSLVAAAGARRRSRP